MDFAITNNTPSTSVETSGVIASKSTPAQEGSIFTAETAGAVASNTPSPAASVFCATA